MTAEGPHIPEYDPCDLMAAIVAHPCHDAALEVFDRSDRSDENATEIGQAAATVAVALGEMSMANPSGPARLGAAKYAEKALTDFQRVCRRQPPAGAMSIKAACADCPNKLKV